MSYFNTATYVTSAFGNPAPTGSFFSLSAANGFFSIFTAGTYGGKPVKGVLVDSNTLVSAVPGTTQIVTLSGAGDIPTVLHFYKKVPTSITLCLMNSNNLSTTVSITSATSTAIFTLSSGTHVHKGPDDLRRWNLTG